MTWIKTIAFAEAEGPLRKLYDRISGPGDNIDNILLAHSLRPHTLEGHMTLYKHVLHHPRNTVENWFLEAIGVYVSMLNACGYCIDHHYCGLARLLGDNARAAIVREALETDHIEAAFSPRETAALAYVRALTENPAGVAGRDIEILRATGWGDGEILEINQVAAYFGYANRTVLGLGVDTGGDILGLSPGSEEGGQWRHS